MNGTILLQRTPNSAGITIHAGGSEPTYIKQAFVSSSGDQLLDQKNIIRAEEKKPSKEEFRNRFLAGLSRRQQSTPTKDTNNLQIRKS